MLSSVLIAHLSNDVRNEDVTSTVQTLNRLEIRNRVIHFEDVPDDGSSWSVESDPYECVLLLSHGNTREAICTDGQGKKQQISWPQYVERVRQSFTLGPRVTLINGCCYGGSPAAVTKIFESDESIRFIFGPSLESSHDDILLFTPMLIRELRKLEGNAFGLVQANSPYLAGSWTACDSEEWSGHVSEYRRTGQLPLLSTVRAKGTLRTARRVRRREVVLTNAPKVSKNKAG